MLEPPKEDIPWSRAKEKPQQDGRRGAIIPETLGGHKQNLVYTKTKRKEQWPPQETGTDLPVSVWESPAEAWVSGGLARGQRLWQQQSWEAQCVTWVLLKEVTISPTIELLGRQVTNWKTIIPKKFSHCCENSRPHNRLPKGTKNLQGTWLGRSADLTTERPQDWGNRDSWRTQTKSCAHQNPGERSCEPTRDWARLACVCLGVSDGGMGWQQPVTGSGTLTTTVWEAQHAGISPFSEEDDHYPHHGLASGQTAGRKHSPTHQQKIGLKTYWTCPCPPEQDPVFPRASPFHQESCTSLIILFHQRADRMKPQSQKTNQAVNTWTTILPNSMKLWATACGATQDRWVMVESSDKTWSIGEGNGKPHQHSCLENIMNSMKRQKDITVTDEPLGW